MRVALGALLFVVSVASLGCGESPPPARPATSPPTPVDVPASVTPADAQRTEQPVRSGEETAADAPAARKAAEARPRNTSGEPPAALASGDLPIPDADRVIAGLRAKFRGCYQTGLNVNPMLAGRVLLRAQVGPDGEVISVKVAESAGLTQEVAQCLASVVKRAQFTVAEGGRGTTLNVPIRFENPGK